MDPGEQLTGTIMGAFMSYVLVPQEHGVTRLLLKIVMGPPAGRPWGCRSVT